MIRRRSTTVAQAESESDGLRSFEARSDLEGRFYNLSFRVASGTQRLRVRGRGHEGPSDAHPLPPKTCEIQLEKTPRSLIRRGRSRNEAAGTRRGSPSTSFGSESSPRLSFL